MSSKANAVIWFGWALLMVGLGTACSKGDKGDKGGQAPTPDPPPSAGAGAKGSPAPPTPPPPVATEKLATREEAVALLQDWLRSQNDGDFVAYSAFYALRFAGIKRSGPRAYHLDRKGWMADRERMFKKPMVVQAEVTGFHAGVAVCTLDIVQEWSSARYRDKGPKRFLLVRDGGKLRIGREEMLKSSLDGQVHPRWWFAHPGRDPWIELGLAPGPTESKAGLSLSGADGTYLVRKALAEQGMGSVKKGDVLSVLFRSGGQCNGQVDQFALGIASVPHFGTEQCWQGGHPEDGCAKPVPEAEQARELWSRETPGQLAHVALAGKGKCKGEPLLARPASLGPWRVATSQAVASLEPWNARLFGLAAHRKAPLACAAEKRCEVEWRAFRFADSEVIWTSGLVAPEGCNDMEGLWAVWKGRTGGQPKLFAVSRSLAPGSLLLMMDADTDGTPEFVVSDWVGSTWDIVDLAREKSLGSWSVHYYDCPC